MIICRQCKQAKSKSESEMKSDNRVRVGHTTICKKCDSHKNSEYYRENKRHKKNYDLKRNYGISLNEYHEILKSQNHKCAICFVHVEKVKRRFAVDHDHKTGSIRGLLCGRCNKAIGLMDDNTNILRSAVQYLESFGVGNGQKR